MPYCARHGRMEFGRVEFGRVRIGCVRVEGGVRGRRFFETLLPGRGVRIAVAALLGAAVASGLYAAHAAPPAMATQQDDAFQTSIPAAVLLDPDSDSLLFDKN